MENDSNDRFAFISNGAETVKHMLGTLELQSLDDLFKDIPADLHVKTRPSRFPGPHSELEAAQHVSGILSNNISAVDALSFIGSGLYNHYIPAAVEEIQGRAEFRTSYTPYAPEMSQGLLQTLFEYQSMICELTGLNAANNSMYDWATAAAEAALMCARIKNTRDKPIFLIAQSVLPDRYETILTYTSSLGIGMGRLPHDDRGRIDIKALASLLTDQVVGIYLETPNIFGVVEDNLREIVSLVHGADALAVVGIDPISLGTLEAPGNLGADICVGEGQPLGNAPNFGGPLLGIFTAKDEKDFLRNLPGRVIGHTMTKDNKKNAYIMTLQTREQHIRREKATSNLCTNEALFSVGATAYLALLGPGGLHDLGMQLLGRIGYIFSHLKLPAGFSAPFVRQPHFKEFTLSMPLGQFDHFRRHMMKEGILIGRNVGKLLGSGTLDAVVLSVSEKHTAEDLDSLLKAIMEYKMN